MPVSLQRHQSRPPEEPPPAEPGQPARQRRRSTIRVRSECDGMVYSMVFEGSLAKLRVRQLKRHLQETTRVPAEMQCITFGGLELPDDVSCRDAGVSDGAVVCMTAPTAALPPASAAPSPCAAPMQHGYGMDPAPLDGFGWGPGAGSPPQPPVGALPQRPPGALPPPGGPCGHSCDPPTPLGHVLPPADEQLCGAPLPPQALWVGQPLGDLQQDHGAAPAPPQQWQPPLQQQRLSPPRGFAAAPSPQRQEQQQQQREAAPPSTFAPPPPQRQFWPGATTPGTPAQPAARPRQQWSAPPQYAHAGGAPAARSFSGTAGGCDAPAAAAGCGRLPPAGPPPYSYTPRRGAEGEAPGRTPTARGVPQMPSFGYAREAELDTDEEPDFVVTPLDDSIDTVVQQPLARSAVAGVRAGASAVLSRGGSVGRARSQCPSECDVATLRSATETLSAKERALEEELAWRADQARFEAARELSRLQMRRQEAELEQRARELDRLQGEVESEIGFTRRKVHLRTTLPMPVL